MKDYKVNAKVIVDFNDKTKVDINGNLHKWETGEIIKDLPRERFEELQSKGYVEEIKKFVEKEDKE